MTPFGPLLGIWTNINSFWQSVSFTVKRMGRGRRGGGGGGGGVGGGGAGTKSQETGTGTTASKYANRPTKMTGKLQQCVELCILTFFLRGKKTRKKK